MMVLTQDGPCDFSTDEHQNAELQNVSEGPLLQPQDTGSSHEPQGKSFKQQCSLFQ